MKRCSASFMIELHGDITFRLSDGPTSRRSANARLAWLQYPEGRTAWHTPMSSIRRLRTAELLRCRPRRVVGGRAQPPGRGGLPMNCRVPYTGPHLSGFLKPSMRPPPATVQQCRSPGVPPKRRAPCSVLPDADPALLSKPQDVASPKADCE